MTTVAYRAGVMAADTCGIYTGDIKGHCSKLYRKGGAVLAFAGAWHVGLIKNYQKKRLDFVHADPAGTG